MLRLYDSISHEVEELLAPGATSLSVYVCGPTVYDVPHLGHGRFTLVWDVLRRWAVASGVEVRYVSNVTDIDDKIIARAKERGVSEAELAELYERVWFETMDRLNVARPDATPHATAYVAQMTELIEGFLARDVAYLTSEGVYFDVSCVADYGLLAGQPLESLRAGARIEASEEKRSPLDFALWKFTASGPTWPAPFGPGRPGWHTECVVMSLDLLGEAFDLHVGGLDLQFPHHENERAQAVAAHRSFARHWAHHGWVMVGEEKMSKSLDNYVSLTDLLERTDPRAYRLLVLRSHYRSPIEVSPSTIQDAERSLARLDTFARRFHLDSLGEEILGPDVLDDLVGEGATLRNEVATLLDEDLNTPVALARIFDALARANSLADDGGDAGPLAQAVGVLLGAMGLVVRGDIDEMNDEVRALMRARDAARELRDFALADSVREELTTRGYVVEDGPMGTTVRRR